MHDFHNDLYREEFVIRTDHAIHEMAHGNEEAGKIASWLEIEF